MTILCDNDHLGKRYHARVKAAIGIMIALMTFTKTDLVNALAACGVLSDALEAERLFNNDDNMDVEVMVKCLDLVGKLSETPFINFSQAWRESAGSMSTYREMRVLGFVARLMCALIIGHDGGANEDGAHLSVSEYLERCSRLSHMLFFLFRHNKTSFCAAQNYRNWQDTIKNMFVNVALANITG